MAPCRHAGLFMGRSILGEYWPRIARWMLELDTRTQPQRSAAVEIDGGRLSTRSNQLQPLEARVAFLADDDVVVHGNAERLGDLDDRLRHLDVGARRRRVAGGMVVHQDDRGRATVRARA